MTVDDTSSQDSAVIDDDLVEALGFEPVTAVVADDHPASVSPIQNGNGDGAAQRVDDPDHEPADPPTNGSALFLEDDGFQIPDEGDDATDESDADLADVHDSVLDEPVLDEADLDETDLGETDLGEADLEASTPVADDELATHRIEALVASMLNDTEGDDDDTEHQADMTDVDARVEGDEALEPETFTAHESPITTADAGEDFDLVDDLVEDPETDDDGLDDEFADLDLDLDDESSVDGDDGDGDGDGEWSDVDNGIGFLNESDADLTAPVDPVEDFAVADAPLLRSDIDMFPDVVERDTSTDLGLATPGSVFAETPTAPPSLDQTAVVPATAVQPAQSRRLRRRRKLRARKSRRVIRHIDPWSVLTFSVLFHMVVFAALLLSSVLVWNAAIASGMVENLESFIQELGDYETFEINADVMFRAAVIVAGMLTLASSVLVVLLTVVFNLISDLVGGIRVTVIEEETVRIPVDKKRLKAESE